MADFCSINESVSFISQLFPEGEVNILEYLTILSEPEENYCFSIITQVIIRTTAFSSFYLFLQKPQEIAGRLFLKLVLHFIATSCGVIISRSLTNQSTRISVIT